ncbi:hypothetical protein PVAP13_9KG085940 [Panicum virgatum]|uniref:Uncharacterized protein n=1 Tax=Panicum virgatum TaxID=38727 RepID=A0A8T0NCW2_PANVG|nr:hypothetical protein PVAP13_9KG085940 [Panicum virgatum]
MRGVKDTKLSSMICNLVACTEDRGTEDKFNRMIQNGRLHTSMAQKANSLK